MCGTLSNAVEWRRHGLRIPGLTELTGIARNRHIRARPFPPHAHVDGVEIVHVRDGRLRWWVGERPLDVHGGQVTITPMNLPHGSRGDIMEPCELAWLTVFPGSRGGRPFLGLPRSEGRLLAERVRRWPRRRIPAPPGCARVFDEMLALSRTATRSLADRLGLRAHLLEFLLAVDAAQARPSVAAAVSPEIRRACDLVRSHLRAPLTVPELAARSGLSPSRFHRRFRDEVGESPGAYALRLRVEAVIGRIREGRLGLAALAADHGFSSSQYLATCVKRLTGRTPSSFRPAPGAP